MIFKTKTQKNDNNKTQKTKQKANKQEQITEPKQANRLMNINVDIS